MTAQLCGIENNVSLSREALIDLDIFPLFHGFYRTGRLLDDDTIEAFIKMYISGDPHEISRRSEILEYLSANEASKNLIETIIAECGNLSRNLHDIDSSLRPLQVYTQTLQAMEAYTSSIEHMESLFANHNSNSPAVSTISDFIIAEKASPFYAKVKDCLIHINTLIKPIKNVNLAVNIAESGMPVQIGVTDINCGEYALNGLFSGPRDGINSLCDTEPVKVRSSYIYLEGFILDQIEKQWASPLKAALRLLSKIDLNNLRIWRDWLKHISLYHVGLLLLLRLKEQNCHICRPTPSANILDAKDIVYPHLALSGHRPVSQMFSFSLGDIVMITGANSSGKTSALKAFAQNTILAQLGFWIPAREFHFIPYKKWFTVFSAGEDNEMRASRFQQEAEQMSLAAKTSGSDSCILLNEPFTSTNPIEAAILLRDIILDINKKGCTLILVTHIYDVYPLLRQSANRPIRSYVTGLLTEAGKIKHTYTLKEKEPDGRSFARLLAAEYGFNITSMIKDFDKVIALENFMGGVINAE